MKFRIVIAVSLIALIFLCSPRVESSLATPSQDELRAQFEEWTQAYADDDGDGVPNSVDLCSDTKSYLVQLYRAQRKEGEEGSGKYIKTVIDGMSSDFVLPEYHAIMRFVGFKDNRAQLWFPEDYEGKHRHGTECRRTSITLDAMMDNHRRFPCTDYAIVVFAVKNDEVGNPEVIYANIHPLVMIPLEWLSDDDPLHETYRINKAIYVETERSPPDNAHDMDIPVGCEIRFPLKKWKGEDAR